MLRVLFFCQKYRSRSVKRLKIRTFRGLGLLSVEDSEREGLKARIEEMREFLERRLQGLKYTMNNW